MSKKFEYLRIEARTLMDNKKIKVTELNKLGLEGWELCGITNWNGNAAFFYFKRETN